ncbi:MAG: hypothetical protein WDM91_07725 [Rhizomicrobium sp.]
MQTRPQETALAAQIASIDTQRAEVKSQLDRERLVRVTNSVIETITSPQFIEKMRQAREKIAGGAGIETAGQLLSLESLRGAGAEIPEDFRLTSRVFEDKASGMRFEAHPVSSLEQGTAAWGACAGAGGLTFCGCGGFST